MPLFRASPRDQWLDELQEELRGLLENLPARPRGRKLPPEAKAWRAVARALVTRELGANQFGRSYAGPLWAAVQGYAEGPPPRASPARPGRATSRRCSASPCLRPRRP